MANSAQHVAPHSHAPAGALRDADVIITHVEVSDRHGVGKLVQMMYLNEPNILSIRSANYYDGQHELGVLSFCVPHENKTRDAVFARVLDTLGDSTARRVVCIPYLADDVRTAIAVKEIYGAPLCTYIMDDQNICTADGIPDGLMGELLAKSGLRLAISPEMAAAYEKKYGYRMWYMPPLVPGRLIPSRLVPPPEGSAPSEGVIIGNIWGAKWVNLLRDTVRGSGVKLRWYCNGEFKWLPCGKDSLIEDSIIPCNPLKDDPLVAMLRAARLAVLPSGTLDKDDDRRFLAQLSLPSRLPYMMATSHIPIVVLGNRQTAAARFVERFGIGVVVEYDRQAFVDAVNYISRPEVNLAMRKRALVASGRFSDCGAAEWVWQSLAREEAIDRRYEDLISEEGPDLSQLPQLQRVTNRPSISRRI
jgi:hypothetical protein